MNDFITSKNWLYASLFSIVMIFFSIDFFQKKYDDDIEKNNKIIQENNAKALEAVKLSAQKDVENAQLKLRGFADVNLYQGVKIHIEGINIKQKLFSKSNDYLISKKYGGEAFFDLDSVIFDPDLPNRGLPNLNIQVLQPRSLVDESFFQRMFNSNFNPQHLFGNGTNANTKVDSFNWESKDDTILVERHLLQFAVDVSTQYNRKNDYEDPPVNETVDIFGRKLNKNWEWDNQRYPPIGIVLSFNPSSPELTDASGVNNPSFAIAAVELISIQKSVDDEKSNKQIGADSDLTVGKTLPLYKNIEDLPTISRSENTSLYNIQTQTLTNEVNSLKGKSKTDVLNGEIFNKTKYSIIRIANIGTVSEGNIFIGTKKTSEAFRFVFALHLYVVGNWITKYKPAGGLGDIKQKALIERKGTLIDRALTGLMETFVPSLNMGSFGRYIVIGFFLILVAPFFPVLIQLMNLVFSLIKAIISLIPKS